MKHQYYKIQNTTTGEIGISLHHSEGSAWAHAGEKTRESNFTTVWTVIPTNERPHWVTQ